MGFAAEFLRFQPNVRFYALKKYQKHLKKNGISPDNLSFLAMPAEDETFAQKFRGMSLFHVTIIVVKCLKAAHKVVNRHVRRRLKKGGQRLSYRRKF